MRANSFAGKDLYLKGRERLRDTNTLPGEFTEDVEDEQVSDALPNQHKGVASGAI